MTDIFCGDADYDVSIEHARSDCQRDLFDHIEAKTLIELPSMIPASKRILMVTPEMGNVIFTKSIDTP